MQLKVPLAGLTPYPAEGSEEPESSMFVTVTPVAMMTLGDTSGSAVKNKYANAYTKLAVPIAGNAIYAGEFGAQGWREASVVVCLFLTLSILVGVGGMQRMHSTLCTHGSRG